ncbi:MAG: hypothetical protein LHV69_04170 [Elusimicrobia bacterium]|nr:hypothetical protein [Candidatus Obscuribacterium magneticum]
MVSPSTFYCSVMAVILTVIYGGLRIGFGIPWTTQLLPVLGVSLFFLHTPYLFHLLPFNGWARPHLKWMVSNGFIAVAGILVVALLGFAWPLQRPALLIVLALGFGAFGFHGVQLFRSHAVAIKWTTSPIVVLFSVWLGGFIWSTYYHDPLFLESLPIGGGFIDTFFHMAGAQMLDVFHRFSTGLDGPIIVPYHFASHYWFAQLSRLLSIPLPIFYQLGYPVICLPLFMRGFFWMAEALADEDVGSSGLAWGLLTVSFVGLFPVEANAKTNSFHYKLISESYVTGNLMCLLFLSTWVSFRRSNPWRMSSPLSEKIFISLLVPLGIAVLGCFKVSLLFVLFGVYAYYVFRFRRTRSPVYSFSLLISLFLFVIMKPYFLVQVPLKLHFLHFFKHFVEDSWRPFFIPIYFFWAFVYAGLIFWLRGMRSLDGLRAGFRQSLLADIEILLVTIGVGALPMIFLEIETANAVFFSSLHQILVMVFILAIVPSISARWKGRQAFSRPLKQQSVLGLGAWGLAFFMLCSVYVNWQYRLTEAVAKNIATRRDILYAAGQKEPYVNASLVETCSLLAFTAPRVLPQVPLYPFIQRLMYLSEKPISYKRETAVYIPSRCIYWALPWDDCGSSPFILPALTGMAMVGGLDPGRCSHYQLRGYESYNIAEIEAFRAQDGIEKVCARAVKKGFSRLLVMENGGHFSEWDARTCTREK